MLNDFVQINDGARDYLSISYFGKDNKKYIKNIDITNHMFDWTAERQPKMAPDRKYISWDGKPVYKLASKHLSRTRQYDLIEELLSPEEKADVFCNSKPKYTFCDIETKVGDKGFPTPDKAAQPITCIGTSCDSHIIVRGSKPLSDKDIKDIETQIRKHFSEDRWTFEYRYYARENAMMDAFSDDVRNTDILTGWNFTGFDMMYIMNRNKNIGVNSTKMSPIGIISPGSYEREVPDTPYHILVVDYMKIYKMMDNKAPSYKLDDIGLKEVGIRKVTHSETLDELYEKDYKRYIYYNAIDCGLVQKIDEKVKSLAIACMMCQYTMTKLSSMSAKTAITENYMRHAFFVDNKVITKETKKKVEKEGYEGAFVAEPVKGLHKMITCNDYASLYPTSAREFNIGPEVLVGKFEGATLQKFKDDWEHYIVTPNGTVYKREDGYFKKELTRLYNDRKKHKKTSWICKQTGYELGKLLDADASDDEVKAYIKEHAKDIATIMNL